MKASIWTVAALVLATAFGTALIFYSSHSSSKEGSKLNAASLERILSVDQDSALHRSDAAGVKAPIVTLKALDGNTYTIGGENSKPIVLQFWASWCEACTVEAPTMKRLHEAYQNNIDFYGINLSSEEKQADDISAFVQQNQWGFINLLDANKRASYLYELHALPTTFIIDTDGTVLDTFHLLDPLEFKLKLDRITEGR
ncbi:hypothetical protein BK133_17660 [Paenibacillus sp. FSL H8-0548]|uniref:TlpA family protein disulfide reductase n=1 Tax=Paenibacillus sp. FSL H8-0548 TaxID=1920422 RepID=UPI00096F3365|nr:TlpA disulfide reductase family protein [Paenibacillus sp. FSL H8-0548]OMF29822.1 hypothetical protein BK133_17660 [Paenibacillus sp. FSL H8-0548]